MNHVATQSELENDYRKNTIYKNTKLIFDKAEKNSKGTILLIHGTAPQNIKGQLAYPKLFNQLSKTDPSHYIIKTTYSDLVANLNKLGWDTVRYTRVGVYDDRTNFDEYAETDLNNLMVQLKSIWKMIPKERPRIVFAWSGGSVHALQMPLAEADALVILGGISTKRVDVALSRVKDKSKLEKLKTEINELLALEDKASREDMHGFDMPLGRFFDENNLQDNWNYLKPHIDLPTLILHGDADIESDVSQARIWEEKLPNHKITTNIKKDGNHAHGTQGNQPDMQSLASDINLWLDLQNL
jgi:pimeloyl-ACP methyl ester carboxylesterase